MPVSRSGKRKKKSRGQDRIPPRSPVRARGRSPETGRREFAGGEVVPFYEVCPDAGEEMRVLRVQGHPRLPDGDYGLVDGFCADPDCDCRVIYIFVASESRRLASITFGWEPLEFYRKWMGADKVDGDVRALKGPALMPMAPQSELADDLLELVAFKLRDNWYVDLLKRHYRQFKDALRGNGPPPLDRNGERKKKRPDDRPSVSAVPALSPEHPPERCVINRHWRDAHMASIVVVRKASGSFTAAVFLVDTWGVGLKDGFGRKGLNRISLDQLLDHAAGADALIDCPLPLAQELVYGGLAWARQHGFTTPAEAIRWLKMLPAPPGEPDFSLFGGKDRKPAILGSLSTVKKWLAPIIGSTSKD